MPAETAAGSATQGFVYRWQRAICDNEHAGTSSQGCRAYGRGTFARLGVYKVVSFDSVGPAEGKAHVSNLCRVHNCFLWLSFHHDF